LPQAIDYFTVSLTDGSCQFQPKLIIYISEHHVIADIQTQEAAVVVIEGQQAFVAVQDLDLMFVGGGCVTGSLF